MTVHRAVNPVSNSAWCGAPDGDVTFKDDEITCDPCSAVRLYGGPIDVVRIDHPGPGFGFTIQVEHVGPDRHDEIPFGRQCRCGWIQLGKLGGVYRHG